MSKSVFEGDGVSRVSAFKFDPTALVVKSDLNGRHELPDIEWLIQDIARNGQAQPVIIRKDGERAVLVAGFSRWRAIVEINKRKLTPANLPILCTYFQGSERDGFVANVRENRFRNATTELDDAHNIVRLQRFLMQDEDIARVYFPDIDGNREKSKKAIAWVKKRARLANLTPEAVEAVKNGRLKPSAAAHIAELASYVQREVVAKPGPVTSADVAKAEGRKRKLGMSELKSRLNKVWETGKLPGDAVVPQSVIDWLEALLKEI